MDTFKDLCDSLRANCPRTTTVDASECLSEFLDEHARVLADALLDAATTPRTMATMTATATATATQEDPGGEDDGSDDNRGPGSGAKKNEELEVEKGPNTRVEKITIDTQYLSKRGCLWLGEALRSLPALRFAELRGFPTFPPPTQAEQRRNDAAMRTLLEEFGCCPHLCFVTLVNFHLTDSALEGLQSLLSSTTTHITDLGLCEPIIPPSINAISDSSKRGNRNREGDMVSNSSSTSANFAEAMARNSSLEVIDFFAVHNPILNDVLSALENHPSLKCLELDSNNEILDNTTGLQQLLESNSTGLESLIWKNGGGVPFQAILYSLRRNSTVKKLHITDTESFLQHPTDSVALKNLFRSNTTIENLSLSGNSLTNTHFRHLAEGLFRNSSLKELDLSYTDLHGIRAAELLKVLIQRNKGLISLDVSSNDFGGLQGTHLIANALRHNTTLEELFISNLGYEDDEISVIIQAVASNRQSKLKRLDATRNFIGPPGIMSLTSTMPQTNLEALSLSGDQFGSGGVQLLADHLEDPQCRLESLNLDSIGQFEMGDAGLRALADALPNNTTLKSLSIGENHYSLAGLMMLFHCFPQVQTLKILDFEWNGMMEQTLPGPTKSEVETALVEGLKVNKSLIQVEIEGWELPVAVQDKVQFYTKLNRYRPLLVADEVTSAPPTLWPHVFAKVRDKSILYTALRAKIVLLLQNQVPVHNPRKRDHSSAAS